MNKTTVEFTMNAAKHGFGYVIEPVGEIGVMVLGAFIKASHFAPSELIEVTGGDLMHYNAETGHVAFPTSELMDWAMSKIAVSDRGHVIPRIILN